MDKINTDKINTIEITNKHLYLKKCAFIEIDNFDGFMEFFDDFLNETDMPDDVYCYLSDNMNEFIKHYKPTNSNSMALLFYDKNVDIIGKMLLICINNGYQCYIGFDLCKQECFYNDCWGYLPF